MRVTSVFTLALTVAIAAPAAGRSAALLLPAPSAQRYSAGSGWLLPEARSGKGLVYVGSATGQFVGVYEQGGNHKQVGSITKGVYYPYGLFVDAKRNLYVTNLLGGTVTVYPPGRTSPAQTLTGAGVPVRVAVGPDGTVYVASLNNVKSGPYYGPGYVLAYRKGKTKPSKTIVAFHDKRTFPLGLALDSAGDLFVAFNRPCIGCRDQQGNNVGEVLEFAPGASTGTNLGIRVDYAISCTIDRSGNLLLLDQHQFQGDTWDVDVFAPGSKKAKKHIDLGFRSITDLALDRDNDTLWVSWFGFSGSTVFQLAYPSGSMIASFAAGPFAAGIATSPAGSP